MLNTRTPKPSGYVLLLLETKLCGVEGRLLSWTVISIVLSVLRAGGLVLCWLEEGTDCRGTKVYLINIPYCI
jgi:hypothetical protein